MKIAVPFEDGQVFQHFGRSAQFKFYEAENGQLLRTEVSPTNGQGHGALAGFLAQSGVDTLICGGIGGGAQMALAQAGIKLYGGVSGEADAAVAALLAGITSLINLFEAPTATLQEKLHLGRTQAVAVIGLIGLAVGLSIQGIVSGWMDVCSIYACPVGALLAGVFFFWVYDREECLRQVNLARTKPLGRWFYPTARYLFCGVTVLVLILGAVKGGIG